MKQQSVERVFFSGIDVNNIYANVDKLAPQAISVYDRNVLLGTRQSSEEEQGECRRAGLSLEFAKG